MTLTANEIAFKAHAVAQIRTSIRRVVRELPAGVPCGTDDAVEAGLREELAELVEASNLRGLSDMRVRLRATR